MSVEASYWAWRITSLQPGAKLVLMAIADYADEQNCCWPSRRMLAERSVQSPETVSRRLADLEAAGLIERTPRLGANGGRTSDMIRLLVGGQKAAPAGTPPCQIDKPPPRQSDEAPLVTGDEAPLSTVTTQEPSIEPSEEESPLSPPEGGEAGKAEHGDEGETRPDTQFDVLIEAYQPDPTFSERAARRAWARLSATERAEALAGVPRYLAHCLAAKRKACDPARYLTEKRWSRLPMQPAKAEAGPARAAEDDPVKRAVAWALNGADRSGWVFVEEGSDAWAAWREAFHAAGFGHRFTVGRHELIAAPGGGWARSARPGRTFPRHYPPSTADGGTGPPGGLTEADRDVLRQGI